MTLKNRHVQLELDLREVDFSMCKVNVSSFGAKCGTNHINSFVYLHLVVFFKVNVGKRTIHGWYG